jgi:putative ABC transport system permease protein
VFQSMLFATLRNLARDRTYAAVGILGLAIGLCAAMLAGLSVYQQLSFEHFIPGYDRTYTTVIGIVPASRPTMYLRNAPGFQGPLMQRMYPEIEAITRLAPDEVTLKQGQIESTELIHWADPSLFDVLPLPVIRGSLKDALQRPDSIVLTEQLARKYFGDQNPIGRTLLLGGDRVETVTAVLKDFPIHGTSILKEFPVHGTHLRDSGIFIRGTDTRSGLATCDRDDIENAKNGSVTLCGPLFFRIRAGADIHRMQARTPQLIASFPPLPPQANAITEFLRIDRLQLHEGLFPGARSRMVEAMAVGVLILFASCTVFINLATARATRRAKEVGVRKACGAHRAALIAQFLGESLLTVVIAAMVAMSMTELLLPRLNAFLDSTIEFDYWRQPVLMGWIALGVLLVGVVAGLYPALVLSAFRPKNVLKGSVALAGRQWGRQILVISQCAILIGLIVASAVIYQQRYFATHEALRVKTDRVLLIESPCRAALVDALRALPGIAQTYCSNESFLTRARFCNCLQADGSPLTVDFANVEFGAFGLYGVSPVAGAIEERDSDSRAGATSSRIVINEAAVRALGYASASAAIGQPLELKDGYGKWVTSNTSDRDTAAPPRSEIIAVVPDFAFEAVTDRIRPSVYWPLNRPTEDKGSTFSSPALINVKLKGKQIPETLRAIDRLWNTLGQSPTASQPTPIHQYFLRDYLEDLYRAVLREAQVFGMFALIAIILASLGLLGLASAIADRRTKEVGIRKAVGAGTKDILLMLLRQFSLPIVWASLLAWPISAWLLNRWLDSFARHVSLQPLVFLGASLLALLISVATVASHVWRVANTRPVVALHYE